MDVFFFFFWGLLGTFFLGVFFNRVFLVMAHAVDEHLTR